MKKTTKKMTIVSLALCASAFACVGVNMRYAAAQSAVELTDFEVASVALRVPDAQYGEGLRFKITMPKTEYDDNNVGNLTTGVLLIPTTLLGENVLTVSLSNGDLKQETGLTWTVDEDNADNMATYVHIYDIEKTYYASAISLRAYIDDADESTTPAYTDTVSCSVAYSADYAYNNDTTLDDDERAALQKSYLTYDVVYHNGNDETKTTGVYNQKLTAPQDPEEKTGYTFEGWWNKTGTVQWDFDTNVIGGVTTNLYAKFAVDIEALEGKIDELPETTVRTTEIDGKIAEIDALLEDVADTNDVSNYDKYATYKQAYASMGYLALDMSNNNDVKMFSISAYADDEDGNYYSTMTAGTFVQATDTTYGNVLELSGLQHGGSMARVNFTNETASGKTWQERLAGCDYVVFDVYNPLQKSAKLRIMRSDWGIIATYSMIYGWNRISMNVPDYLAYVAHVDEGGRRVYMYWHASGDANYSVTTTQTETIKISNFYGYTTEGLELMEAAKVNETIEKIDALPETEIQTAAITAQIQAINTLYAQLTAEGKAKVTNYAAFTEYVTAYDKLPILKADLATLQSKQYGGSTFVAADASIAAPEGVNGEVIKATQGWANDIASMIAIYDTENLRNNYQAWTAGKALLDNTGSKYSDHYVSFWVKGGDETVTLSITTYSSDWSTYSEQRVTIEANSDWQRVVLPIIADGKDKTNDKTYGWLAVMKLVDPDANLAWLDHLTGKKNGSFYMCNFEIYANNPNA